MPYKWRQAQLIRAKPRGKGLTAQIGLRTSDQVNLTDERSRASGSPAAASNKLQRAGAVDTQSMLVVSARHHTGLQ